MPKLISMVKDPENGLTAAIYLIDTGYSVSFRDADADETIGIRIFQNYDDALIYRRTLINQKGDK